MARIEDIDKNLKVDTNIEKKNIKFLNPENAPFKIYGVFRDGDCFCRIPKETAKKINDGVYYLNHHTSGGRICFVTDSPYIVINAEVHKADPMVHMAHVGISGFDVYVKENGNHYYKGSIKPLSHDCDIVEGIVELHNENETYEVVVNMPLYGGVKKIHIGVDENSQIKAPQEYKISKPAVYYGSSITQGGCASRPGMAYQAIISRELDCDFINLGFSGSAMAEQEITDYIKNLDMSLFVMDYDHNAPSLQHLEATHEKMFKCIREKNPDLPILIMSRPKYYLTYEEEKRLEIIKSTYDNAVSKGDKNVYFIDGSTLMNDEIKDNGTVDDCHPTDLGFFSMAQRIIPVIKDIFKNIEKN